MRAKHNRRLSVNGRRRDLDQIATAARRVCVIESVPGLHRICIGRTHARTHIIMVIHNRDIRIIDAETGELLRELTIDPTRDYQPQKPQNPLPKEREM